MYMDGVVQVYVRVNACGLCFIYVVVSIYIYIYPCKSTTLLCRVLGISVNHDPKRNKFDIY